MRSDGAGGVTITSSMPVDLTSRVLRVGQKVVVTGQPGRPAARVVLAKTDMTPAVVYLYPGAFVVTGECIRVPSGASVR